MKKILLVEDDNNLREIYGARLLAEGYDIVSAKDGEEALSMAVSEKPDLIISDIMMPKISGFDMLDILRATPQTRDVKVIMMTALSQAEDKERGERLGADRYLVKSQVTLEDVVKVVQEVIGATTEATQPAAPDPVAQPAAVPAPAPEVAPAAPVTTTPPPTEPAAPVVVTPAAPSLEAPNEAAPATLDSGSRPGSNADLESANRKPKVIEPISDLSDSTPDINRLLQAEMAKEQVGGAVQPDPTAATPVMTTPPPGPTVAPSAPAPAPKTPAETADEEQAVQNMLSTTPPAEPTAEEQQVVNSQIQDFVQTPPAAPAPEPAATPPPTDSQAPPATPPAAPAA